MKDFSFESLNGEFPLNVNGGCCVTKDTNNSQASDHACGSHGCGFSSGLMIG